MRVLKIVGQCVLGLVGLVVLLYLVGVAINWRDQPPSTAALQMKEILTNRPPVANADNSFVYLMGFSVPATVDPEVAGAKRVAWIEGVNRGTEKFDADPVAEDIGFNTGLSPTMKHLKEICGVHSPGCRDVFLALFQQPRSDLETLQLLRYRTLLQKPVWREVLPLDIRATLPRYAEVLDGQRLMLAELAARAATASPREIFDALNDDFTFWRGVLTNSDFLISRMIAVAALRNHFFFGSLVLREMPAGQAGVVAGWASPFTLEDLSMRRAMAGELAFSEALVRQMLNDPDIQTIVDADDEAPIRLIRFGWSLARPYFQPQDQNNFYAAEYLDFSMRFEVPLSQYAAAESGVEQRALASQGSSFHVYNAIGHVLRRSSGLPQFSGYAVRTGSVEGMRRAAMLAAQLRIRRAPLETIAGELAASELRDPFTQQAFEWSEDEKAVVYVGPDAEGDRKRHPYYY